MLQKLLRKLGYVKVDHKDPDQDVLVYDMGSDHDVYLLFSAKPHRAMGRFKKGAPLPKEGEYLREHTSQGDFHYQITKVTVSEGPCIPDAAGYVHFFLELEGPL